jgi:hypothetical protein
VGGSFTRLNSGEFELLREGLNSGEFKLALQRAEFWRIQLLRTRLNAGEFGSYETG